MSVERQEEHEHDVGATTTPARWWHCRPILGARI
jgi:hypothetical protein